MVHDGSWPRHKRLDIWREQNGVEILFVWYLSHIYCKTGILMGDDGMPHPPNIQHGHVDVCLCACVCCFLPSCSHDWFHFLFFLLYYFPSFLYFCPFFSLFFLSDDLCYWHSEREWECMWVRVRVKREADFSEPQWVREMWVCSAAGQNPLVLSPFFTLSFFLLLVTARLGGWGLWCPNVPLAIVWLSSWLSLAVWLSDRLSFLLGLDNGITGWMDGWLG